MSVLVKRKRHRRQGGYLKRYPMVLSILLREADKERLQQTDLAKYLKANFELKTHKELAEEAQVSESTYYRCLREFRNYQEPVQQ